MNIITKDEVVIIYGNATVKKSSNGQSLCFYQDGKRSNIVGIDNVDEAYGKVISAMIKGDDVVDLRSDADKAGDTPKRKPRAAKPKAEEAKVEEAKTEVVDETAPDTTA